MSKSQFFSRIAKSLPEITALVKKGYKNWCEKRLTKSALLCYNNGGHKGSVF